MRRMLGPGRPSPDGARGRLDASGLRGEAVGGRPSPEGVLWTAPGFGDEAPGGCGASDDWACDCAWPEIGCETPWEGTT